METGSMIRQYVQPNAAPVLKFFTATLLLLTFVLSERVCAWQEAPRNNDSGTSPAESRETQKQSAAEATGTAEKPAASADDADTKTGNGDSTETETRATPVKPAVITPFKVLPYEVHVAVGFGSRCLPEVDKRVVVMKSIRNAIRRMYGGMWNSDVQMNDWMVPATRRRMEWLSVDEMVARFPEQKVHKAFFVTIESAGSGYSVSGREFDTRIHEFTPIITRFTLDDRSLGTLTAELLRDVFRPCVLYERTYQDETGRKMMELQVQAGEIIPPDPSAEQVREGDVLRTFVRQMDRRDPTKLDRLRPLNLSYVRVMSVDRGHASKAEESVTSTSVDLSVPVEIPPDDTTPSEESSASPELTGHSPGRIQGFYITHHPASPFGAKSRRLQHFAVRQRPFAKNSKVRLVLRGHPDKPLVSHRLALAFQLHWKDPEDGEQVRLVSDRNGEVVIQQREGHPTFWIRVYSGRSLLARVPYAPGLIPFDTIELPDDSIRLGVEGEIQLLSDELIDAIALRAVLLARARKAAEAGDTDGLQQILERLDSVPGKKHFLQAIDNIWIPARKKCEERRLSSTFSRRLCDGLRTSVERFFSDEKLADEMRDISVLKATAEKNAAANGN